MTELEELQQLAKNNSERYLLFRLPEGWEEIEEGDWTQEGKYQFSQSIVSKNDKFFAINQGRSGSYHTDWYYDDAEVYEVVREEKIITTVQWVAV
jgi:hypothetical protein